MNKTALITGATSGIGYELSKLFALNRYNLVLVARNDQRLEDLANELRQAFSISTVTIPKDLSIPSSPEEIFSNLREKSIQIDVLVNNAGFNEYGLFSQTDLRRELQMIQLNIASLTYLTKLLLPGMLERKHGKILNIGSTGSFVPGPLNAVYCATKAYILSFSEAIAEELKETGVTVTTLCPGATKTEFAKRANMEDVALFQGKLMDAKEVARIGYDALMRGKRTIVAGCVNKLTISSIRFLPRNKVAKMVKAMMSRKRTTLG